MQQTTSTTITRSVKVDLEAYIGVEQIAVKRLKAMTAKAEMEFAVEVEILGRVRHKNLLGLRGFYAGGDERLIVYDYMPNHSLITHLHGQLAAECLLDWSRRMKIALAGGVKRDIVQWVTPYVQKGAFDHIADPRLKGDFDRDELKKVIMIAMKCTDGNPENRPNMLEVVGWLKGGVGSRKKELGILKNNYMVDGYDEEEEEEEEDEEDYETDYEVFGMEKYVTRSGGEKI
ncbi:PTI1-like tyrosine-protein kinase [Sesamum alatum]|uniref:non-specific serine/threonine protein kinase n=1 Tax=Sesamum alatum TaxID=300844 RepID=A0AAE1YJV7_9LAMI|nr:PTI1-like tyrosine-protein kinase [Sesamum alatum]